MGGELAGCSLTHTCTLETPSKVGKTQWRCPNFPLRHLRTKLLKGTKVLRATRWTALCKVSRERKLGNRPHCLRGAL